MTPLLPPARVPVASTSAKRVIPSDASSTCAPVTVLGARSSPSSEAFLILADVIWLLASFEKVTALRPIFELLTDPGASLEFRTRPAWIWALPTLFAGRLRAYVVPPAREEEGDCGHDKCRRRPAEDASHGMRPPWSDLLGNPFITLDASELWSRGNLDTSVLGLCVMDALTVNEAAATTGWSGGCSATSRGRASWPPRSASGYRLYGPGELQRLRTLRDLLERHEVGLAEVGFARRLRDNARAAGRRIEWRPPIRSAPTTSRPTNGSAGAEQAPAAARRPTLLEAA